MFNIVLARVDYFRIYVIETKLDFVSFDDKDLQSRRKLGSERDFLILNGA